ncbi:unnamed protein product [Clonostachys solani]|uniref:Major facilitator superfamily (MFS) profile domain-containing protein n=1 Tax=Clonostachys solani TaxID=160281 RepID=A0A9N9W2Y1_9HYPO|nr:unnamed protein product [Clonostachys solani]
MEEKDKHRTSLVEDARQNNSSESAGEVQDWNESEEKALVRKIDLRVFPMLCVIFGLSLLDRTNISLAYIAGLSKDLQLQIGARYNVALLVFFIGYGIFELPSNLVIRRVGARWWLSFLVTTWGASVLGMGFIHNWQTLTVLRTLLGIFEAGLFPGAVFIIGSWYKQFEMAKRISFFYMAALVASGFGPIIAYALSLIRVGDGMYAAGWRWIFIIEGAFTVAVGIVAMFLLVDFPEKATFLNPREKHIAANRVHADQVSREYEHPTVKQALSMLKDWKVGVYTLIYFVPASSVYSLSYFKTIILNEGMGFNYAMSQLLSSPPYLFAVAASMFMAWISDRYRIRWMILCIQSGFAIIGLLIMIYGKLPGVRYFGMFLAVFGAQSNVPGTLAYGQNQTARPEKRGVVSAAMISIGAAGGIAGSTMFRSQDAPLYLPGMWSTIALQICYSIAVFSMSMYLKKQNRLADQGIKPVLEGVSGFRYAP